MGDLSEVFIVGWGRVDRTMYFSNKIQNKKQIIQKRIKKYTSEGS